MMKKRNLYLIRHGRSEGNANHKNYITKKDHEIDLTLEGVEQARNLEKEFQWSDSDWSTTTIFCSPYDRCINTLHHAIPMPKCPVMIDYRLREQHIGTPTNEEELMHNWNSFENDVFYHDVHGSEFPLAVFDRVHSFLDSLSRHDSLHNIIFTHGHVINVFKTILTPLTMKEHSELGYVRNGSITKLTVRI
jgi:broad specificity phosphatase PhoE